MTIEKGITRIRCYMYLKDYVILYDLKTLTAQIRSSPIYNNVKFFTFASKLSECSTCHVHFTSQTCVKYTILKENTGIRVWVIYAVSERVVCTIVS